MNSLQVTGRGCQDLVWSSQIQILSRVLSSSQEKVNVHLFASVWKSCRPSFREEKKGTALLQWSLIMIFRTLHHRMSLKCKKANCWWALYLMHKLQPYGLQYIYLLYRSTFILRWCLGWECWKFKMTGYVCLFIEGLYTSYSPRLCMLSTVYDTIPWSTWWTLYLAATENSTIIINLCISKRRWT